MDRRKRVEMGKRMTESSQRYMPIKPGTLETKKAWVRETAARFLMSDEFDIHPDSEGRRAQAFRAVDMAILIWTIVEGRFLESTDGSES